MEDISDVVLDGKHTLSIQYMEEEKGAETDIIPTAKP